MTNPKFWQAPFDQNATFIVASWPAGYTHKGEVPRRGTVFDKAGVKPNILATLYETRWIRMSEAGEAIADPRVEALLQQPQKRRRPHREVV